MPTSGRYCSGKINGIRSYSVTTVAIRGFRAHSGHMTSIEVVASNGDMMW